MGDFGEYEAAQYADQEAFEPVSVDMQKHIDKRRQEIAELKKQRQNEAARVIKPEDSGFDISGTKGCRGALSHLIWSNGILVGAFPTNSVVRAWFSDTGDVVGESSTVGGEICSMVLLDDADTIFCNLQNRVVSLKCSEQLKQCRLVLRDKMGGAIAVNTERHQIYGNHTEFIRDAAVTKLAIGDYERGEVVRKMDCRHGSANFGAALFYNGMLFTGGEDGSLCMSSVGDSENCISMFGHSGRITGIVGLGNYIVTSSNDRTLKTWDIRRPNYATMSLDWRSGGHSSAVTALAIHPESRLVASGSCPTDVTVERQSTSSIKVWDMTTVEHQEKPKVIQTTAAPLGEVRCLAMDGERVYASFSTSPGVFSRTFDDTGGIMVKCAVKGEE